MARLSKAAYKLVDLAALEPLVRQEIIRDANDGGGEYGVRVVEIIHNGPAQMPLYGVYNNTPEMRDEDKWASAKERLQVVDGELVDTHSDEDEDVLRNRARASADAVAAAENAKEAGAISDITKDEKDAEAAAKAQAEADLKARIQAQDEREAQLQKREADLAAREGGGAPVTPATPPEAPQGGSRANRANR